MSRSPLAYPLNRSADTDVGGAADLQTDIMRFMAILALCLVAIFALVQSIPLSPVESLPEPTIEPVVEVQAEAEPVAERPEPIPEPEPAPQAAKAKPVEPVEETITLTRPKWVPKFEPKVARTLELSEPPPPAAEPQPAPETRPPAPAEKEGFTLRFESDAALTRAVAASHVGLYAIESDRAQRMTVSNSRISFWDASTPNTFHEMEAATVPTAVINALRRTGTTAETVSWGVTLPGRMTAQLDALMQAHRGGSLIIGAAGDIRWEAT